VPGPERTCVRDETVGGLETLLRRAPPATEQRGEDGGGGGKVMEALGREGESCWRWLWVLDCELRAPNGKRKCLALALAACKRAQSAIHKFIRGIYPLVMK
jgi:hypothetical protein